MLFMAPTFDIVDAHPAEEHARRRRAAISPRCRAMPPSATAQVALRVVLMAHSAWMMGDAIVRTLYRLFVSRRNLLEWRTASQAHKSGDNTLGSATTA